MKEHLNHLTVDGILSVQRFDQIYEVYVDDNLVKSVRRSDHLCHLNEAFDLL